MAGQLLCPCPVCTGCPDANPVACRKPVWRATADEPTTPKPMENWTWDQFKAHVDSQIKEAGRDGSVLLDWIDWPTGYSMEAPQVLGLDARGDVSIQ